jgi:hypothetical protein
MLVRELRALQGIETARAQDRRKTIARELVQLVKASLRKSIDVSLRPKPDRRRHLPRDTVPARERRRR